MGKFILSFTNITYPQKKRTKGLLKLAKYFRKILPKWFVTKTNTPKS